MLLFHGTSEYAAMQALKVGLRPRGQTGVSNWQFESNKDSVYLTDTYACHYALNAKQNGVRIPGPNGKVHNRMAVIEVDTSRLPFTGFRADEDFLAFREAYSDTGAGKTVTDLVTHHSANLTTEWKLSLKLLGTCSFADTISPRHFTRIALFDVKTNRDMAHAMMDGNVSPMAYKFAGHYHRAYTRWLFGEPVTALDMLGLAGLETIPDFEKPRIEYWEKNILANRAGVEVINLKEK